MLLASPEANSQTTNSTVQTVSFGVSRPIKPILHAVENLQQSQGSITSSEINDLQSQLKQQSSKVTVSAMNTPSSSAHMDLLSVLESKQPIANSKNSVVLTVTE